MTGVRAYGLHLLLDGYGGDEARLRDIALVFETLDRLPAMIGMRKIGFPHMASFDAPDEIAGVSGVVMIMESHISIHTYAKKGFLTLDAYSCRSFDHRIVVDQVRKTFGLVDADVQVLDRGLRFPAELPPK